MTGEIITILLAAAPISEIRGALPVGIGVFDLAWPWAYFLAIFGNMLPVLPLMYFWKYLSVFLMQRSKTINRLFSWLFERTRSRHEEKIMRWGAFGLFFFVAIPLPITGAWTATVATFIFGITFKRAFFSILLGVMVAGVIVLFLTYGFIFLI